MAPRPGLRQAAADAGMVWAGLFALGIGFGVLVTGHGLPWWLAPVISGTLFAGSLEFVLVGMLAVSAPVSAIALTTLLVNSRHLFYGLSFPLHRVQGRLAKAYSVFALCDEAFALLTAVAERELTQTRMLWTQFGLHASWACGALVGGLVGASVLGDVKGLDFVLTALFLVLAIDCYRTRPDRMALVVAVVAGVLAAALAPGSMLVVAMTGFTGALVLRHRWARRRQEGRHA